MFSVATVFIRKNIPLLFFSLVLMALFSVYWSTVVSITRTWWRSETFAHGIIIIPIVLFLIWQKREELVRVPIQFNFWGLIGLLGALFGWFLASLADALSPQQFSLVAMIVSIVLTIFGSKVSRTLFFPLAYLFFAVPFGEFLIPPMMDFTAAFTVAAVKMVGVPVYLEGRYLYLPTGNWHVAEACSGVRYLIASLALGSLYAYLSYQSFYRRFIFIALSALIPVLANGIRAFGIVMIGHLSDMKLATGIDHIIYGWIFFGVVISIMFWVGSFWYEPKVQNTSKQTKLSRRYVGAVSSKVALASVSSGIVLLLFIPVWLLNALESELPQAARISLPQQSHQWQLLLEKDQHWQPVFHDADAQVQQIYRKNNRDVSIYIALYLQQQQGKEMINVTNRVYQDGSYWKRLNDSFFTLSISDKDYPIHQVILKSRTDEKRVIWYWYSIDGYLTTDPILAKLYEVWVLLQGKQKASAVIAIATNYQADQNQAIAVLKQFLTETHDDLSNSIVQPTP